MDRLIDGILQYSYEGQIWVRSEINQGTTFYFTLPKARVSGLLLD